MKITICMILTSLLFTVSCSKKADLFQERISPKDTVKTGNKLSGIVVTTTMGTTHYDIGQLFIDKANKGGVLEMLRNENEGYLETYYISKETIKILFKNKPLNSLGVKFSLVQIDKSKYEDILDISNSSDSILYIIASYVNLDYNLESDQHHFVFNLKNNVTGFNKIIDDSEFSSMRRDFKNDLAKKLSAYYNRLGKGNTNSIFYSWGEYNDILYAENYKGVNFKFAEIVSFSEIQKIISTMPGYHTFEYNYKISYEGREKQLTVLGDFVPEQNLSLKRDYFDMGSLQP